MLARSLAMLVGALTLGAATADAASAGTIEAFPSIQGAGTISTPSTTTHAAYSCTQPDPVSAATALTCRNAPWTASGFVGIGPAQMALTATPAPGWTFAGWSGCPSGAGAVCTIEAPAGNTTVDSAPRARFEDRMPPAAVPGLAVTQSGAAVPSHVFTWGETERDLRWQCSLDGGPWETCRSGFGLAPRDARHRLEVSAIDRHGNVGPRTPVDFTVVDTRFRSAPSDGATLRSATFEAASNTTFAFECSIDGGPFTACGNGMPARLTLPALRDGSHTLRVRGRSGVWYDPTPVSLTWTQDTTAPETTLRRNGDHFDFGANERGWFRCSLDGAAPAPCTSPYTLPAGLTHGAHSFEVDATDLVGNQDMTPARHYWTIATPTPVPTPTPAPTVTPQPGSQDQQPQQSQSTTAPAIAAPAPVVAPAVTTKPVSFALSFKFRKGRLTQLKTVGLPAGTKLVVTVNCPRKRGCPKSPTTLRKLVGKRLAKGTKITVGAGGTTRTLTIPRSR